MKIVVGSFIPENFIVLAGTRSYLVLNVDTKTCFRVPVSSLGKIDDLPLPVVEEETPLWIPKAYTPLLEIRCERKDVAGNKCPNPGKLREYRGLSFSVCDPCWDSFCSETSSPGFEKLFDLYRGASSIFQGNPRKNFGGKP